METIAPSKTEDNSSAVSEIFNKFSIDALDQFLRSHLQPPAAYTLISDKRTSKFMCTVSCMNETKTGIAKSKKEAKRMAAQSLLKHMVGLESLKFGLLATANNGKKRRHDEERNHPSEESLEGDVASTENGNRPIGERKPPKERNFTGQLWQYCQENKLPRPLFKMVKHTTNAQGQSEFFMKCMVTHVEKLGVGLSKKQAKRNSSKMVLEALRLDQSTRTDGGRFEQLPLKRLKLSESATDVATSSVTHASIVVETKNEETQTESLSSNSITHAIDPGDNNVQCDDDGGSDDDDCLEITDTMDVFWVESSSDSS